FFLKQAFIRRDKQEIINASGFWNIDSEQVQLSLLTHDLNLNHLSQMFGLSPDAIRGTAFCEVYISNTLQTPEIKGELQILDGGLGKIPFDSLGITLGDGLDFSEGMDPSEKLASKFLNIPSFSLIQSDKLAFTGNGSVPLDANEELKLSVVGTGDVLSVLELLAPKIEKATGVGELSFVFGGLFGAMKFQAGELRLNNGQLRVPPVLPDIDNIDFHVKLDPETQFLKIVHLTADFAGEGAVVGNSLKWPGQRPRPARVRPFLDDRLGLIFGHFTVQTNEKGISLYIPGLMKVSDRGWISGTGISPGEPLIVGGPVRHPYVTGRAELRDFSFSIPFYDVEIDTSKVVYKFLTRAEYDAVIIPRSGTRYVREIAHVPDILEVDVVLTEKQGIHLSGTIADKSIRLEGGLEANRGIVEYLNLDFRIEQAGVRFDKSSVIPEVYGRARTSLSDSTGASYNLYLTLYTTDPNTGEKRTTGRLNEPNMYFELSSDNPNLGMSEGQILSNLGVSPENIRLKAPDLIGMSADNLFLVPIFRPVERTLQRFFGLDYVKVRPVVARNLLERNMRPEANIEYSRYYLFNNSRISLGKYLSEHWFLSYTGELKSLPLYQPYAPTFGLRHQFGLEYMILPNLLFEMEYDYNSMLLNNKSDKRFMLRHSFPF
ncbi:translocation/assembly module TamB domain-containing protein, partial [bacterium]|nr:translocation/assembly module TamB domain-containing protein [bacterium]